MPTRPSNRNRPLSVVLIVRRLSDVGGAQTQARLLARQLRRRGCRVVFLTERVAHVRPPKTLDGIPVHHVRSLPVRFLISFCYVGGLVCHLLRHRADYDLVHVFFMKHSALGAVLAGAFTRTPVVVRPACAGPPGDLYPLLRGRSVWRRVMEVCRRASAFVALSEDLVTELVAFGCPPERIHRIPSGVALPERVSPPSQSAPEVVFAGRLDAQKGLDVLLEAWRRVVDEVPGARLTLLGDGPQRSDLEETAQRLGITRSVTFAGVVDDVPARLHLARAFVLPSTAEGMSSALLEAMAAGRPVVATRVSGSTELVRHGREGLLAEPGDAAGLAAALRRLLADTDLADRLGRNARERVRRRYSDRRLAEAHLALYHRLLEERGRGPRAT